jgi:hypothetical protein
MADLSRNARNSVALQREVFRLAEHEHGLSIAVLARTRDIAPSTIKGWRDGSAMPLWAIGDLRLPDDLSSMLLDPWGKHVGTNETDDGDIDELEVEASGIVHEIAKAKRDKIVTPQERARIASMARRLVPAARAVAA